MPLVEKVRSQINTWTCRFLPYVGRLQVIKSILMSIVNFWLAFFRLLSKCIKEVEQLCASFLWTGPVLKSTGAKVSWRDVCKLKSEGGLGIRMLKEATMVFGLKLIRRMLSCDCIWGKWIKRNLLKSKSFWEVKLKAQAGSWMWRKILKLRNIAKTFYKKKIGNGQNTSFLFDNWSGMGVLIEVFGDKGIIDMGLRREATVEEGVSNVRRRRRHHTVLLNYVETELMLVHGKMDASTEDISCWRGKSGFKDKFLTHETWGLFREMFPKWFGLRAFGFHKPNLNMCL